MFILGEINRENEQKHTDLFRIKKKTANLNKKGVYVQI